MNYMRFVEDNRPALGKMMKVALDLAHLLEHSALRITAEDKKSWMFGDIVKGREEIFNAFCAVLANAGLPLPPLERVLWESYLPKVPTEDHDKRELENAVAKVTEFQRKVLSFLVHRRTGPARKVRAILQLLEMFPIWGDSTTGLKKETVLAKLTAFMVDDLALEPIRPDYAKMSQPRAQEEGPGRTMKFLIFDDSKRDLMKTALALVGIPNVRIEPVQYVTKDAYKGLEADARNEELRKAADQILALEPQVVFMDEGLIKIEGFDLVPVLRRIAREHGQNSITCIPNSGGSAEKLMNVCAGWDNFKKGENRVLLRSLLSTLRQMSQEQNLG